MVDIGNHNENPYLDRLPSTDGRDDTVARAFPFLKAFL